MGSHRSGLAARMRALPDDLRVWGRTFALVLGVAPAAAALYLALALVDALLPVLGVWLAKLVVDALAAGDADRGLVLALAYLPVLALPAAGAPLRLALAASIEDRATREIDRRLMGAGARMADLGLVERPAFRDELGVVQMSVYYAPVTLRSLDQIGGGALTLAGLLFLLGGLHPLLPLALAAVALPHLAVESRYFQLAYEAMGVRSRAAREMEYYQELATEPDAAKEVRVYGLGGFLLERYQERFLAGFREVTRVRVRYLRAAGAFAGLHAAALAGGFWYVAARAGAGALTLGDLALYLNGVIAAEAILSALPGWIEPAYSAQLHLRGLFGFLERARPTIALPPPGAALPAPARLRAGIELRGVSFRYPEGDDRVLEDITLSLRAGQVTALVGANGAGKSTIVKLLTRMYDPDRGTILLDGAPLPAYELASLRSRVAVAYQDAAHFALTLGENIAVGRGGAADEREIARAARAAGADAVARERPAGYGTELTTRYAGGVELSGGEWQKVALARAFVRDAALVILDEPTSALDADAEHALFERFRELALGRTALIISHRFSTVRMADRIAVIEGGRVVEEGSHAELVEREGVYAELFEIQARRYRE